VASSQDGAELASSFTADEDAIIMWTGNIREDLFKERYMQNRARLDCLPPDL